MPYSKNPDKYPPELQVLPDLLARTTLDSLDIPVESRGEANARKTQLQSFFVAIERRAQEMRALAHKARDRKLKAANLAPTAIDRPAAPQRTNELREAKSESEVADDVASLWEERAKAVACWMVRVIETPQAAVIRVQRRQAGAFGTELIARLQASVQSPATIAPAGQLHQPTQEELLEQLRAETAQLNAANGR